MSNQTMENVSHTFKGQRTPLHPVLLKWLQEKNFSVFEIEELLSANLKNLPDFDLLLDLEKSAQRIIKAIANKEAIGIYGDYDVDGTTSCALLYKFFKLIDVETFLFQPGRFIEGYGLHCSSIDLALQKNIKVLITVDCGITSFEAAQYALLKNIDLIITDHHKDIGEHLPVAYAIINPNRRDQISGDPELKTLAGVGVAFVLALKIKKLLENEGVVVPSLYSLLQLVALGTLCDMARLTPLNLKLVRHGLKVMAQNAFIGLRPFLSRDDLASESIATEKLTFEIGPIINSKGRLDHAEKSLEQLISDDPDFSFLNFNQLTICNRERKSIQAKVFEEAKQQALKKIESGRPSVMVLYSADWHEGVIGIVASKMVEHFSVPTVIFTNSEHQGLIKASARATKGGDIFSLLNSCQDLFYKFGGHKAAAGLTMVKENLSLLENKLLAISNTKENNTSFFIQPFDIEISSREITPELHQSLVKLGPFGEGHPKPLFLSKDLELVSFDILKDLHVRWNFKGQGPALKGISFNYIGRLDLQHPKEIYRELKEMNAKPHTYFYLDINKFQGKTFLQLMVQKVEIPLS